MEVVHRLPHGLTSPRLTPEQREDYIQLTRMILTFWQYINFYYYIDGPIQIDDIPRLNTYNLLRNLESYLEYGIMVSNTEDEPMVLKNSMYSALEFVIRHSPLERDVDTLPSLQSVLDRNITREKVIVDVQNLGYKLVNYCHDVENRNIIRHIDIDRLPTPLERNIAYYFRRLCGRINNHSVSVFEHVQNNSILICEIIQMVIAHYTGRQPVIFFINQSSVPQEEGKVMTPENEYLINHQMNYYYFELPCADRLNNYEPCRREGGRLKNEADDIFLCFVAYYYFNIYGTTGYWDRDYINIITGDNYRWLENFNPDLLRGIRNVRTTSNDFVNRFIGELYAGWYRDQERRRRSPQNDNRLKRRRINDNNHS